jgi:hypothetical protein
MLGYGVGWVITQPLRTVSNFSSILSTVISCASRFLDEKYDGGGLTWSNAKYCAISAVVTGMGFVPEVNLDAAAANYQYYCRDLNQGCWGR